MAEPKDTGEAAAVEEPIEGPRPGEATTRLPMPTAEECVWPRASRITSVRDVMTYQPAEAWQIDHYNAIQAAAERFALVVIEFAPDCADRTAALRAVREARMWANAAIALRAAV